MTNDEVNRKISEAREPRVDPPDVVQMRRCLFDEELSPGGAWVCRLTGKPFDAEWIPRDWTDSEVASAILLDELAAYAQHHWSEFQLAYGEYGSPVKKWDAVIVGIVGAAALDRKEAIAQAWLMVGAEKWELWRQERAARN